MTHVTIREVCLRDGLQIEEPIPLAAKLELLEAVVATGVREVEATAFVSPSKVPALADADELAAELKRFDNVEFSALVASPNGAKRAIAAGLNSIEYVVSAADSHSRANVGRDTAEATAAIADITRIAHDSGATVEVIIATAWDCPFDGPTPPQRVLTVAEAATAWHVDRIAIADTIGTTTPGRVSSLIAQVRPVMGDIPLGAHFHNTRGAGLASAYAAVQAGVTRLDASVGGLGGCPFAPGASGNIATEDLVYLLRDSGVGVDVDLQKAVQAAAVAQRVIGHELPSALLRAGDRILGLSMSRPLSNKGQQTRDAIEQAARKLFAERGFHGTTLADITSAAGKSSAVFYRYFDDKEDLLAVLAESFLHDVLSGLPVHLPDSPEDTEFFTAAVTGYWNIFKQNLGIMVAVAQLGATQQRFAKVQNEFRRFGMDIVRASVLRAQEQGYGADLDAEHIALAIALLFENFTTVYLRPDAAALGVQSTDEDAVRTLATIWKKTLYGY